VPLKQAVENWLELLIYGAELLGAEKARSTTSSIRLPA